MPNEKNKDCFVIMPIADAEGYPSDHFTHVYENIIKPACSLAEYKPVRADEVNEANLIHLDILKKLIEAPMAICDLSNRNPNVLFELGIRQAFDKPVVLIQERGTPKIFDIAPLRYIEYPREMKYHEVMDVQKRIKASLLATAKASSDSSNVNSIVQLLALNSPAKLPTLENNKDQLEFQYLQSEMKEIKRLLEKSIGNIGFSQGPRFISQKFGPILKEINKVKDSVHRPLEERHETLNMLQKQVQNLYSHGLKEEDFDQIERVFTEIDLARDHINL